MGILEHWKYLTSISMSSRILFQKHCVSVHNFNKLHFQKIVGPRLYEQKYVVYSSCNISNYTTIVSLEVFQLQELHISGRVENFSNNLIRHICQAPGYCTQLWSFKFSSNNFQLQEFHISRRVEHFF